MSRLLIGDVVMLLGVESGASMSVGMPCFIATIVTLPLRINIFCRVTFSKARGVSEVVAQENLLGSELCTLIFTSYVRLCVWSVEKQVKYLGEVKSMVSEVEKRVSRSLSFLYVRVPSLETELNKIFRISVLIGNESRL